MKKLLQSDAFKNFGSSAIAILIGLLIGAVVIFISNSSEALDGLRTLLAGPVRMVRWESEVCCIMRCRSS